MSTLQDLELKRFALMSAAERPKLDWGAKIAHELSLPKEIRIVGGDVEREFQVGMVGDIGGDAMAAVLLSQGRDDLDTVENRKFATEIARNVIDRLGSLGGSSIKVTEYDLSVLIEAVLIEAGAFEVAKSLVSQRSRLPKSDQPVSTIKVIRRNGQVVPWSPDKIEIAVRKAFLSYGANSEPAVEIALAVSEKVLAAGNAYVGIETVQDLVQEELMRGGHFKVAEHYITYGAQRALMRVQEKSVGGAVDQFSFVEVIDADGNASVWDGEDLRRRIDYAMIGLDLSLSRDRIEVELRRSITPHIPVADLRRLIVMNAKTLMEKDADFRFFAGRILLTYIYEEVLGWDIVRDGVDKLKEFHAKAFLSYIGKAVKIKRLAPDMADFDLPKLAAALDPTADLDFDFLGIQTLYDRYLITDKTTKTPVRLETPQMFWLRVEMGLFRKEDNREDRGIEL